MVEERVARCRTRPHRSRIVGDKVIKKQEKKHPSNEKVLAQKAGAASAAKAAAALAAAKTSTGKPGGKK